MPMATGAKMSKAYKLEKFNTSSLNE